LFLEFVNLLFLVVFIISFRYRNALLPERFAARTLCCLNASLPERFAA
jgi:hypothetical protein